MRTNFRRKSQTAWVGSVILSGIYAFDSLVWQVYPLFWISFVYGDWIGEELSLLIVELWPIPFIVNLIIL
ncbi:MAG: hypothetical protein ACXACR_09945, partial [Candidatus Hodarchaeales archaeon]